MRTVSGDGKGHSTRDRLVEAAIELFDRDGYDATSLESVCRRVSVTKGALYRHFPSKQALAVAVAEEYFRYWHEVRARVEASGAGPLAALIEVTCRMCALADRAPAVRVGVRLLFTSELFDLLAGVHLGGLVVVVRDLLARAVAAGEVRPGTRVREEADAITAALAGAQALGAVGAGGGSPLDRMTAEWRHRLGDLVPPEHRGSAHAALLPRQVGRSPGAPTRRWLVDVTIDEQDRGTTARARLRTGDDEHLVGTGSAPGEDVAPGAPGELAAARALSDLARQLLDTASSTHLRD
ncbi:TetR family transcriptional regulator [Saccharothrix syringae]|uniref:TetR family transcriptional regulator n=1 Tax=Saccharothrix syringae TaxID=103733 RepID=UPI0014775FBA|nr:TetR family transcriptional regulator [Saccharothrix syringae]